MDFALEQKKKKQNPKVLLSAWRKVIAYQPPNLPSRDIICKLNYEPDFKFC